MAERENQPDPSEGDVERSSEDIRQDIAIGGEKISRAVNQIDERIQEKLDWRGYVKDSPYWALGAAVGLGYLASRVFMKHTTPLERIKSSIAEEVRESFGGLLPEASGPGLMKVALLGIATEAAVSLIKNAALTAAARGGVASRPHAERGSTVSPRVEPKKMSNVKSNV